ncbi:Alpha-aminoadipate--LysW ligase LysX [Peribacillus sp. Bi96]|uniref:ATP-grasp domain-containing protein n=1 Tax=unclassified Peribacillus TaxID=2675266 RepID=UPI001E0B2D4A|nr:ATP-grasp domain-containing protein [Peribacillus sp. Bi96]CAH0132177.1 Alpha-aminoadipate--LysW ligase LysX [Peribacillus sp. Bi96]
MRKQAGWLIYNREDAVKNKGYIDWMLDEASKLDLDLQFYHREDLRIGHRYNELYVEHELKPIALPDFAIVRTIDPFLTRQLEQMGIACFNSSFVSEMANDKAKTHQYLSTLGIPMADTVYCNGRPNAHDMEFPFIAKETHGRGGKQVYLIEHANDLVEMNDGSWIVQKPGLFGKDIRVFVVGNNVKAAVLRESASSFKANYTLGGSASIYELTASDLALVERVIDAFDFGLVGIDFIFDDDGSLMLNEIEDVVGSRTLSALSDMNIVREYLTFIKERITS